MKLQPGGGKTYKNFFLKLTLEYCLRRLKRCTILTEGRTHSWKPYSTPGHSYILPKYKQPYIVNCTFTSTHTHTEGTQATLLFKHPHALTLLVHIAFVHYALCKHKWREGKRKKQGGLKKNKKGGGARRDRDSPAVLPKTHIPRDPWAVCLSPIHTHAQLTHTRCSHHMAVKAQMGFR